MKTRRWAMALVLFSTLCAASGQILIKRGINRVGPEVVGGLLGLSFESVEVMPLAQLLIGYLLYALAAGMLVVSLKYGELSVLYPIYAMNFVWVAVMSPVFFETDSMSAVKWVGIASIVLGVSLIGRGSGGGSGG